MVDSAQLHIASLVQNMHWPSWRLVCSNYALLRKMVLRPASIQDCESQRKPLLILLVCFLDNS